MKNKMLIKYTMYLLSIFFSLQSFAAASGELSGIVKDSITGEVLPGVNIQLEGTAIGTSTNIEGIYVISNIPAGTYTLKITFLGYKTQFAQIEIKEGEKLVNDFSISESAQEIGEVVVSGQLLGQRKAINSQLNSDAMVNIISSDKIKELPDVNAAEAIGRLSGVSVNRNGGEASKVVIRGMSPELTNITINGVRMPSTSATDRSVDLSIISPELLSNIEVFKSPTADMDGDAIGGIINLGVSKAPKKQIAVARIYGGYNGLDNKLSNYKGSFDLSKRFLENKLGIVLKGNYEKTNRSSEQMNVTWNDDDTSQFLVTDLKLTDDIKTLQRIGGSFQADYDYKNGSVVSQIFYSERNNESMTTNNTLLSVGRVDMAPSHSKSKTSTFQGILSGKQKLPWMEIDWLLGQSNTVSDNFYDVNFDLVQHDGVTAGPEPTTPEELYGRRNYDYTSSWIERYTFTPSLTDQKNYTAGLDFKIDYNLGKSLGGFIKFGGKYRKDIRTRDVNSQINNWYYALAPSRAEAVTLWPYPMDLGGISGDMLMISNLFHNDNNIQVWNDQYAIGPAVDMQLMDEWHATQKSTLTTQYEDLYLNYNTTENVAASYIMTKLNIGQYLTVIPGVRYEYSDNEYTGTVSSYDVNGNSGSAFDSTTYQKYGEFLPSLHIKIKPTEWVDVRLSAVKTISRPGYDMITPRARLDITNGRIYRGNPDLLHATAWNYDAMVSFFSNKLGLLTVGGFYKQFDNFFSKTKRTMSAEESLSHGYPNAVFEVNEDYLNFDNSQVYGFEFDYQTNFSYLPAPFNGFVVSLNFTRLYSKTYLPLYFKATKYDPALRRSVVDFDKSYWENDEIRLPDQVDLIANASIGYDHKIFSVRISAVYQSEYLSGFNGGAEAAGAQYGYTYIEQFLKFDASAYVKIGKHIKIMGNVANFTNEGEQNYRYLSKYPSYRNQYGMTIDLGLEYKF